MGQWEEVIVFDAFFELSVFGGEEIIGEPDDPSDPSFILIWSAIVKNIVFWLELEGSLTTSFFDASVVSRVCVGRQEENFYRYLIVLTSGPDFFTAALEGERRRVVLASSRTSKNGALLKSMSKTFLRDFSYFNLIENVFSSKKIFRC
jgi:hypothetical protein